MYQWDKPYTTFILISTDNVQGVSKEISVIKWVNEGFWHYLRNKPKESLCGRPKSNDFVTKL